MDFDTVLMSVLASNKFDIYIRREKPRYKTYWWMYWLTKIYRDNQIDCGGGVEGKSPDSLKTTESSYKIFNKCAR
jgi:hypothetical protein